MPSLYPYYVAALRCQKVHFSYLVKEEGIVFLDLPKGHSEKGDGQLFLLGGHIVGMLSQLR